MVPMKAKVLFILLGLMALVACAPAAGTTPGPAAVLPVATQTIPPPVVDTAPPARPPTSAPAGPPPSPTATMDQPPAAAPTAAPSVPTVTATAAEEPAAAGEVIYGRTAEGAYFHGAAGAPVTLIDYSDFL